MYKKNNILHLFILFIFAQNLCFSRFNTFIFVLFYCYLIDYQSFYIKRVLLFLHLFTLILVLIFTFFIFLLYCFYIHFTIN